MTIVELIPESVVEDRRLGWHRHHKASNKNYPVDAVLTSTALTPKRWGQIRTPLDQGQIGRCTGNATCRAVAEMPGRKNTLDGIHKLTYNETLADKLYRLATQLDAVPGTYPPDDTGSTTVGVLSAAKQMGLIKSYRWAFSFDVALATLSTIGPVVTGVDWYEGFDHPRANGELVIDGKVRGGHELAVDLIDPNVPGVAGGGYVGGWQSWGKWGPIGGRFLWSFDTWRSLLAAGGEVGVGLAT